MKNGISDHEAQILSMQISNIDILHNQNKKIICRGIHNVEKIRYFCSLLENENWENIFRGNATVNEKFDSFLKTFKYYFDLVFPEKLKKLPKKQIKDWMTSGLRVSSQKLKDLYALTLSGEGNKNSAFIANSNNKSKAAWKIINPEGSYTSREFELKIDNILMTDPDILGNKFNNHFNNNIIDFKSKIYK